MDESADQPGPDNSALGTNPRFPSRCKIGRPLGFRIFHAVVSAAAKEGPNPPPAEAINALIKAVRELNSSAVLLNQLMKQIHLIKFRQSDPPDEREVRSILIGVSDTAAAVRHLLADWHPRNPYKR